MSPRELPTLIATAVVAVAAIFGGAFFPAPRMVIGAMLAVALGGACTLVCSRIAAEEWAPVGFIVWGVVSAVAAAAAPLAARETIVVWLISLTLWAIGRRAGEWCSRAGLAIVAAGSAIVALGVILESVGLGGIRVGGLLENPNIAAALLVVSIPALLILDVRKEWRLAAGIVVTVGLVMTGSRAGLLGLLVVGVVTLPRGKIRVFGLVTGGISVAAILIWRFASQPDVFAWFRPSIWSAVLRIWGSRPFAGVGPGGLLDAAGVERLLHVDHVGHRQFSIAYAESTPLAVLVQTGLVGLLIAVIAIVLWWARLRRRGAASVPMVAALVAMAVMGAFHDFLTADIVLWWWAVTIGLIEARAAPGVNPGSLSAISGRNFVKGLLLSYVVLWGVVEPAWARWLWRSGGAVAELVTPSIRAEPWYDTPLEWRSRDILRRPPWTWREAAEAVAQSARATRIHPGAAKLWSLHGTVQSRLVTDLGPWPESIRASREAFSRAVELEPHQPWAWLEWARLERNIGEIDRAIELVESGLAAEPHTVRARLFLARLELDRGRPDAAHQAYELARRSAELGSRQGLSEYERDLVTAPAWQFLAIEEALR